jgi:DNA mismatch repair protein MutS
MTADVGTDTDDVTGVPPSLRPVREELTPMLTQYADVCERHPDALVLFQVGDFYEAFCEAAEATARVCEVTLTKREDSTGEYPMAGIPIDNAASYLDRLLAAGYRVAVADQVEDAEAASGLVDRAVTRVVTPGTVTDDDLLGGGGANYVASVVAGDSLEAGDECRHAVAAVDVSTGECRVTSGTPARVREELDRLAPAELLVGPDAAIDPASLSVDPMVTAPDPETLAPAAARECLAAYVASPTAVVESEAELRACGACLAYAEYTQGGDGPLEYVSRITRYDPREFLRLDAAALGSLELFDSRSHRTGTALVDVLDRTVSAPGRRRLEAWLRRPLVDHGSIEARHAAVEALVDRSLDREALREALSDVYDLERLVSRVSRGRANARDLRSLGGTLAVVPPVRELLVDEESDGDAAVSLLATLRSSLVDLSDVRELVESALVEDPPQEITEGGLVREGFDDELDALRETEREGREWVADLEERERERTGIDSLSVGHNAVHGYYIEVTDPNLEAVPDDYTRRQTLKNAERFYTPELKRREDEILGAADRADSLEYELFCEVRAEVAEATDRIQQVADALASLDALAAFADAAVELDYARPAMHDGRGIHVEAGRHPVVEREQGSFVPNDTHLGPGELAVVTGPNMSGKSTYMRQVALACVLAQAGSFVPADGARLPVVDRVFTRVGASDDIAGGQSTFMREMAELTNILHSATADSLVLLDEVGRGTSTTDGRAIARAAAEFLHDEVCAHTLFATHYHELADLAAEYDRAFTLHFSVERTGDDVAFLHRVEEGAASSSYGIEVAQMAGVPAAVVQRARDLVAADEADRPQEALGGARGDVSTDPGPAGRTNGEDAAANRSSPSPVAPGWPTGTDSGEGPPDHAAVVTDLAAVDIARTTPLEALNRLAALRERALALTEAAPGDGEAPTDPGDAPAFDGAGTDEEGTAPGTTSGAPSGDADLLDGGDRP